MSQHVAEAGDAGIESPSDPRTDRAEVGGPAPGGATAGMAAAAEPDARERLWRFFRYTLLRGGRGQLTRLRRLVHRLWADLAAGATEGARALMRRRPATARALIGLARRAAPRALRLAQAEALLTARLDGWAAAIPLFRRIAEAPPAGWRGPGALALLEPGSAGAPVTLAGPAAVRPAETPPGLARRIVVYTTRFGGEPAPPPPFGASDRIAFLCFSDRALEVPGWRVLPAEGGPLAAAEHRIRAHAVLAEAAPEAEFSLYLAPDALLVGNLDTLLNRWLADRDLALWRYPHGVGWGDMALRRLIAGDGPAEAALARSEACLAEGLADDLASFDVGALWRRHRAPEVVALMEAWWALQAAAPGPGEIDLYRVLHGPRAADAPATAAPVTLPAALGTAEDNIFLARTTRPRVALRGAPAAHTRRLPITFLYSTNRPGSTTTLLRGKQLSDMIAARYGDIYDVSYVRDAAAVRGQIVVVTKEAITDTNVPGMRGLRARNAALIGSWEDDIPDPDKTPLLDAHMTSAIRQMLDLNRLYPRIPAFNVTHHVNPLVPWDSAPTDRLRTGYFGELFNTVRPESLAGSVDLIGTDTFKASNDWIAGLSRYNCHWIVRNRQSWDGWKPFLKGFVAARCGAVVIVTRDDANAPHYLGDDYPFYAESLDPAALEMAWARTAAAFDGPDWRLAQAIMRQVRARSSDEQVCAEFKAMIDELTN